MKFCRAVVLHLLSAWVSLLLAALTCKGAFQKSVRVEVFMLPAHFHHMSLTIRKMTLTSCQRTVM